MPPATKIQRQDRHDDQDGRRQAQGLPWGRAEISSGASRIDLAQACQRPDPPPGDPDPRRGRTARRRPVAQFSQSQPAVSHHLALLRHGGIIAPRRQGKNNFYSLTETGSRPGPRRQQLDRLSTFASLAADRRPRRSTLMIGRSDSRRVVRPIRVSSLAGLDRSWPGFDREPRPDSSAALPLHGRIRWPTAVLSCRASPCDAARPNPGRPDIVVDTAARRRGTRIPSSPPPGRARRGPARLVSSRIRPGRGSAWTIRPLTRYSFTACWTWVITRRSSAASWISGLIDIDPGPLDIPLVSIVDRQRDRDPHRPGRHPSLP